MDVANTCVNAGYLQSANSMGVLVAVSIPIFTAQLKRAKLATNQANARAAYAEVTANMLDTGKTNGEATYSVATAKLTTSTVAAHSATVTANGPIQSWGVSTSVGGGKKLGDETAKTWKVSIDNDGNVAYEAGY